MGSGCVTRLSLLFTEALVSGQYRWPHAPIVTGACRFLNRFNLAGAKNSGTVSYRYFICNVYFADYTPAAGARNIPGQPASQPLRVSLSRCVFPSFSFLSCWRHRPPPRRPHPLRPPPRLPRRRPRNPPPAPPNPPLLAQSQPPRPRPSPPAQNPLPPQPNRSPQPPQNPWYP